MGPRRARGAIVSESTALPDVRDDRANSRFVVEQDGVVAELVYRDEPGRLVLLHTEVPDQVGGRGIGGASWGTGRASWYSVSFP